MISIYQQLGEKNAQLFRELKGRLKPRNIALALGISFVAQLLILMSFRSRLPVSRVSRAIDKYCTGSAPEHYYREYHCLKDSAGNLVI
ncbi:MAG: ABC transporter permease, partial [Okeania sp. SIO2H7]|nr:ABC transporter permease [Okeania sp. SIO2H7]